MTHAEPRFDRDYAYGYQGEIWFDGLLEGLASGQLRNEVKRKRRIDDRFYIETGHVPGGVGAYQPSGLSVTEAEVWTFIIHDTRIAVLIPVALLRAAIAAGVGVWAHEEDGSCPTKGRLVSLKELLIYVRSVT